MLAGNEVQGDLSFELDAMGAVLGQGFHPLKARGSRARKDPLENMRTKKPLLTFVYC